MVGLNISMTDVQVLVERNPLAAEQLRVIALERMVAERDAEIAVLSKRVSENGERKGPVGETTSLSGA